MTITLYPPTTSSGPTGPTGPSGTSGPTGPTGPAGSGGGSGTVNYVAKFTSSTAVGNSSIVDTGTLVTITPDTVINTVTVGLGAGAIATNTAIGQSAISANTTGSQNTAVGYKALSTNSTGTKNTAIGASAMQLATGMGNTAVGYDALIQNTTGYYNVAIGNETLQFNTSGAGNIAIGRGALNVNVNGTGNVGLGGVALLNNSAGNYNTALGYEALINATGNCNIEVGGTNSSGTYAPAFNITTQNNYISMGSTSVTNAYIQVAWTVVSDSRDKTNFGTVPHGLNFVTNLTPISYQFKASRDEDTPNGDVRYGFKAQDILALEGDSPVIIDAKNPEKLYYNGESLVPVLVNAIKEQQTIIENLKGLVESLQSDVNSLKAKV